MGCGHLPSYYSRVEVCTESDWPAQNRRADTDISRVVAAETHSCNERLIASASTRQYESATLPARQMGQLVCDALFSEKQQRQSRYDGGLEEDGVTQRHKSDQMRNRFIDIAQVLIQAYR